MNANKPNPTVCRMVAYFPTPMDRAQGMSVETNEWLAAVVTAANVEGTDKLNLSVLDYWGNLHPRQAVPFGDAPQPGCCTWPPGSPAAPQTQIRVAVEDDLLAKIRTELDERSQQIMASFEETIRQIVTGMVQTPGVITDLDQLRQPNGAVQLR